MFVAFVTQYVRRSVVHVQVSARADPSSRGVLPIARARVCVIECEQVQNNRLHLQWVGRRGKAKKERKKGVK